MLASGSAVIQASVEKIFEFVIDPNERPTSWLGVGMPEEVPLSVWRAAAEVY